MLRILAALVVAVASADASTSVASGLLRIVGLRLEVEAPQALPLTVPLNTPFTLTSRVRDGAGREVHELSALGSGIAVTGELSGAGLAETVAVTAAPGQPLDLPGLGVAGNYTLANLRLVDASGATVLTADPALVPIRAIEKVIVSRVRSRALSLDEIEERGVIITADNFTAYEFSIGVKTESKTVEIPFDVVMGDGGAEVGGAGLPPVVPGLEVPNLEYKGMILEPPHDILSGVKIPPIPGVIVIPGNIAFLNQFFQVLLVVSNVAPEGSELVVIDAGARLALPPGANGVVDDPVLGNSSLNDDPLRPVETALGGTEHVLCGEPGTYAPLLCAAVHNSATGDRAFSPGEDGQGEFLVEGRKVGTHQVEVTIRAELRLATGEIVPLEGKTYGTVLVRHPRFALTLNHPDVVRAGETYSLLVTVTNVSDTMANLVGLSLEPARISGATLVGAGCQQSGDRDRDEASLPPGMVRFDSIASRDAVTARFDLIARKNGRVTAAAFEGDPSTGSGGVAGAFVLRTGIGDAGIPLSPDTLILPPYAYNLPGPFIAEALRVLGLAHSVASAPLASADTGHGTGQIPRIDGATVVSRAQDLAEAGLRVRIRAQGSGDRVQGSGVVFEAMRRELLELWLDWLGNGEVSGVGGQASGFDAGFDEIMRLADAGHDLESVLAAEVVGNWEAGDGSAVDLHDAFVQAEAYRSGFISIAADSDARLTITDGVRETSGCIGAARCPQSVRREVASASILGFDDATGVAGGEWAIVGDASQLSAAAQVTIAAGSTDTTVHVAVPNGDGELQVFEFTVYAGESVTRNLRRPDTRLPTPAAVADGPPRVLGVRQIPEADKQRRGRVVAVLFDQAVDESSLETATFRLSYAPGQEEEQAVGPVQNGLKRLNLFPRKRIVFLQFRSSVSRFFDYEMTIAGVRSRGGLEQIPESDLWAVVGDFPKEQSGVGGIVSGTVRDGNGDPIPFATVELTETFENPELCLPFHLATGSVSTDENGYYRFDFAGDGRSDGCDGHWPFRVRAVDADTGQKAARRTFITFEGERRRLDLLMLGLGRVEGHVWNAECGMGDEECGVSGATVTVTSLVDGGQRHTTTDARGRFAVENVAVGNLEVSAWFDPKGPAGPRAGSVAARLERAGEMAEVEVLISANTAAVEGTVFEECGMGNAECRMGMVPVGGGVDVVAFWFADGNEWGAPTYVRTVETDAAGHFEFPAVPAPKANTVLHVRAFRTETSEQIERTVMLSPGSTTPVNLILPGNATVMGTVVHADGRPAPGAEVVAEQGTRLAVADTSGNFALAQVGAGRQAIFAQDPGSGAQGHVDVDVWPPGGAVAVRITLAGFAGIDGVLRDSTGGLQRGAEVFLWFGKQGFLRTTTDSMGRFSYRRLPLRQDYVLGASDANGAGVNLPLGPLAAGEIRPVVLQFAGVETVTGVVFDDGVPRVVAVRVTYQHFDDTGNLSWQTREVTASAPVGTTRCAVDCASGGEDCAAWAGRFSLVMLRGASYRVQVVDDAFAGDTTEQGGTAGVSGEHCLEMGQSASLHGTVYLPDGERGGAGIEITYDETSGGNPRQRLTDESGEFALEMLPPREYRLSARDPRTGNLGIAFGSLEGSSAGKAEINLLGQGTVRARVLRPGGNGLVPIEGASVDLTSGSPVARLRAAPFPTLVTDPNGIVEFRSVPEGAFSVAAFDELTLTGGRAGGQIVADQEETTVSVIVGASGTVQGRLSDAGGTTPLAFAQVRLRYVCAPPLPCVKRLDDYATSDENGVYRFEYVPVGGVAMECFDPRTGRVGRHQSVIVPAVKFAGDVVTADMHLIPVGGVTGSVLRPAGTRVVGAKVELRSSLLVRPEGLVRDVSLFGPGKLATTSNLLGEYLIPGVPEGEFDLIATEPTTGASGAGGGRIAAEGEVVAVDLTLDGRGAVIGTSTLADGVTPVGFATVVFENGAEQRAVQSDAAGAYRVANVPLGFFTITVREQGGNDGGRSTGVVAEDGEVVRVDVAFGGAGTVSGCARGGDEPLGAALVTLIREDPAGFLPSRFDVFTNSQGEYDFFDVPVGAFTVQLTVDGLSGARSGSLAADGEHVMGIDIELEASGTVTGRVERADGTGAGGAVVALGDSGASFRFFRVADETGAYAFHHVPLGTLVVSVSDPVTGGVGTTSGTLDGESLVLPLITLDDTIPAVESIAPADGTLGVARATEIVITFDDLVDAASVNRDSIKVHSLGAEIPGRYRVESQHDTSVVRFSADDPAGLPEFAALTVEVTQRVRDLLGRPILLAARSTFQTMDQSPPTVLGANLVRGWLVVRWSEAVEWTAPHGPGLLLLADVTDAAPGTTIEGTLVPSESGRVLTFKPTQPLADDRVLALEVSGWTDVFGNAQASVFKSTLDTTDHNPPLIVLSSSAVDGAATIGESVRISAAPAAGVTDILLVDFYAGAQKIGTDNTPPFTHEFVAARDVTFTAQAMDFAGNLGPAESITITLRPNAPPSAIILSPVGGAMVKTGDRFSVSVSASDDLGLADIELTVFENTYAHHVPPGLKSTSHEFLVRAPSHATPDPQSPLRVRARDVSGIMSAVEQITLDLRDGTAPSVQLTSLAGGFVADPAVLVPVSVFASDAAGVARITLTVMGDADHFAEVLFQPVPAVAHEFAPLDLSAAAGGSVTIIVSAEDSAGNAAEAPRVTLTVQGAPSIELIEPDPHNPPSIIGGAAITVRAKTGNALVKQVGFYLDDVLIGTDMTAEPGNVFRLSLLTPTGRQNAGIGVEGIDVFGVHTERRMLVLPLRANGLPVASAGLDRQVSIGLTSTLSGSGSFDPDASPLSYLWRLVDRPADSTATIVNGQQRAARITPDVDGVYTIGLVVNDGIDDSGEDLVVLTAHEATATPTPTDTRSPTLTRTVTASRTITATPTDTRIATETRTSTATRTSTGTPTVTPLPTDTRTPTETRSVTPTRTGTRTVTETRTPTSTRTATRTRTPTLSPTPTMTPAPGEILVNQTTSGYQWLQDACSDAHGNTLIVWSDEHGRLLGRRVDPSEEGGAEFPINELGGNVSHPRVACAPDGRFVVVWSGGFTYPAYTAYFRRYTNSGEPEGESAMVEAGTESQDTPDVAMAADGSFLVVWEESHAIIGKRYDATGAPLGPAFPVSKATEAVALDPAVTVVEPPSDAERHYVLVWREYDSGLDRSALQLGQVPLGTGAPIGDEIEIAAASGHGALRGPALASQPKGEVFVTWTDLTWNLFGREFGTVRAIRVDAGGVPGAALGLGTTYHECFSHGSDKRVSRSADGYAVTWAVARDPETCDYDVFVHLYGADDEDIGDGFQVNAYSAGEQTGPVITCPTECADCPPHCGACAGNCTVVWNGPGPGDSWGIFARRLTYAPMPAPTPTPSGPTFTPTETPTGPAGE